MKIHLLIMLLVIPFLSSCSLNKVAKTPQIEVVPYDPIWPEQFKQEESCIRKALGKLCIAVYHVGSTSVPGLAAKPKIDILAVAKDRDASLKALEKAGYSYRGEWNIPLKCGLVKRGNPDVNLHLYFDHNHPEVELNLKFRDYLRTHPDVRDQYAQIKMDILRDSSSNTKAANGFPLYTLRKAPFIKSVLNKIGYNRLRVLKAVTEEEWQAIAQFRKTSKRPETKNHEHFLLYQGTNIIGYADIEILSKTGAKLVFFELKIKVANAPIFFRELIREWLDVNDVVLDKESRDRLWIKDIRPQRIN